MLYKVMGLEKITRKKKIQLEFSWKELRPDCFMG